LALALNLGMVANLMRILAKQIRTMSILPWMVGVCFACAAFAAETPASSRHVVLVVWDGMRPDLVNETDCPTLWKLARGGIVFRNHHCVYPSATNVNGTAFVTGAYPGRSGVIANHAYRPEINPKKIVDVETADVVRKGDELSGGNYITRPTLAEILRSAGQSTAIATAKTVGLLQDRHLDPASKDSALVFSGQMFSADALGSVVKLLGPFPPPNAHAQKDAWTTKALTEIFWKERLPEFSLLWLGEPDASQHETAPGAPKAHAAIKSADDNLAAVLVALDRHGARSTTDIFVVSDHGFSTIEHAIDLRKILRDAGFNVAVEFTSEPKPGDIVIAGNGGSVLFYVIGHDAAVTSRLVEFLQQTEFAGVILTRDKLQGTFGFEDVKIDNEHAPDVVMSFHASDKKNQFGVPGIIDGDWQRAATKGTHATLGRFDMHNTLIAAGPDIRRGEKDDLPSGNVDLAPTILHILGIVPPAQMDGRILSEALINDDMAPLKPETKTSEATREFSSGTWRQTLKTSRVGSTVYIDDGNGSFVSKHP
jgi:predicted AlkP superfamily pyrophosphatase or phosphodiesterase